MLLTDDVDNTDVISFESTHNIYVVDYSEALILYTCGIRFIDFLMIDIFFTFLLSNNGLVFVA